MGTPAPTRIKVKREDLIARVKTVAAEDAARYAEKLAAYQKAVSDAEGLKGQIIADLSAAFDEKLAAWKRKPDYSHSYGDRYRASIEVDLPRALNAEEPHDPSPTHAKALRILEMSQDVTLSVSLGDALARYL